MWSKFLHHSKVIVLSKDNSEMIKFLDECTVDYVEAKYQELIMDSFMEGTLDQQYDYKAGIITAGAEADPRKAVEDELAAAEAAKEEEEE